MFPRNSLPSSDVVHNLYRTYLTQETCPTADHAGDTAPIQQHELDHTEHTDHTDHTDRTDQGSICPA